MNRYIGVVLAVLLCISMTACAREPAPTEPALSEPSLSTDIESKVEPLERPQHEPESEPESAIEIEPGPELSDAVIPEAAIASEPPPQSQKPESKAQVTSPAPAVANPQSQAESGSSEAANPVVSDAQFNTGAVERELLRLINELREETGEETLGAEESMEFAARIRALEALQSFSHTRPNGSPYNTAFDEAGFSYAGKWHGENLSSLQFTVGMFDEKAAALEMFKGLKNSPGHYHNMVSENFLQAGIGVYCEYGGGMVSIASAQLFSSL